MIQLSQQRFFRLLSEDVYKRQFLDSVPHFGLVVVALRRIDQTVSQSDGVFHTLCGSLLESKRADTQPVSYTHLDVYKRQGQPINQNRK